MAVDMLENGDYVNYFKAGRVEMWNAKPPLAVWAIVLSYRVFGQNEFALRFPSALAILFLVMISFEWLRRNHDLLWSFLISAAMLSVTGILGHHTGRTGDTDAILILWSFLYCIFLFEYAKRPRWKYSFAAGVFLVLAFYTKSTAVFLLLPGSALYLLWRRRSFLILKEPSDYIAPILLLLGIFSWYLVVMIWGVEYPEPDLGGSNAWEVLWSFDTVGRFTEKWHSGKDQGYDWDFLIVTLDVRLGIWFYALMLAIFFSLVFKSIRIKVWNPESIAPFVIFISIPFMIVVQLSYGKFGWYLAPLFPLLMILAGIGLRSLQLKPLLTNLVLAGLSAASFAISIYSFASVDSPEGDFLRQSESLRNANSILVIEDHSIRQYLVTKWSYPQTELRFMENVRVDSMNFPVTVLSRGDEFQPDGRLELLEEHADLKIHLWSR